MRNRRVAALLLCATLVSLQPAATNAALRPPGALLAATSSDPCPKVAAPTEATKALFTRPRTDTTTPTAMARVLRNTICAAAPRSQIRIAMMFFNNDSQDVAMLVDALEFVHYYRGVKVRVVLDASFIDIRTSYRRTMERLQTFGTVVTCPMGCRSSRSPGRVGVLERQHNKFMVISNTNWKRRVDPVVWIGSANWSNDQLNNRWESSVLLRRDPVLAREFALRFDSLEACATSGCGAFNRRLRDRSLSVAAYGVERESLGVWSDITERVRPGTPGRGTSVVFSPWVGVIDPMAVELRRYHCTAEHKTVWLGHLFISTSRQAAFRRLGQMKDAGCDVRIMATARDNNDRFMEGVADARERGMRVGCADMMHDKFMILDVVESSSATPRRVVMAGSHSIGSKALRFSDESMLWMRSPARPSLRNDTDAVYKAFRNQYRRIAASAVPCAVPPARRNRRSRAPGDRVDAAGSAVGATAASTATMGSTAAPVPNIDGALGTTGEPPAWPVPGKAMVSGRL